MKTIIISQGYEAMVDDKDFKRFCKYSWYVVKPAKSNTLKYAGAKTRKKRKTILMHRKVLNAPKGILVDHIDGNGLNNQRSNLRLCNSKENARHSKLAINNTSGYRGVAWHGQNQCFRAYIVVNNKQIHIGLFEHAKEAAKAWNIKAKEFHGEFAYQNKIT